MASTFDGDMDDLRAIGHGSLALLNVAILLAILAVILASGAVPTLIGQFFAFLQWLVGNTVAPVTPGVLVNLDTGGTTTSTSGTTAAPSSTAVQSDVGAIMQGMTSGVAGPAPAASDGSGAGGTTMYVGLGADGGVIGAGTATGVALTPDPQAQPIAGAVSYEPAGAAIGVGGP